MALLTDDQDMRDVRMYMDFGGNGNYYLNLVQFPKKDDADCIENTLHINIRVSTHGGNAPTAVKLAVANLFNELEKAKLNQSAFEDKRLETKVVCVQCGYPDAMGNYDPCCQEGDKIHEAHYTESRMSMCVHCGCSMEIDETGKWRTWAQMELPVNERIEEHRMLSKP